MVARMKALETSRKNLREGGQEVIESIRRIAHSLKSSGVAYGVPQITEMATDLEDAREEDLTLQLDKLLSTLYELVSETTEEEKVGVLIVDDDPAISLLLRHELSAENREILVAKTASEAEKILEEKEISLIILDLLLPDMDGRNILLRYQERPHTAGIPIIVLSGQTGAQTKTECFALGADDYFEKPFDPDILAAAVAIKLQRAREISRNLRQDPLTKIPNRAAFSAIFQRMRSFANRVGAPLCIGMIDIDHFKKVNDTYGHAMGDEVLRRTASVIGKSLRRYDSICRWSGEQFVALLPNTERPGGVRAMEKLLLAVSEERFTPPNDKPFFITFSASVTEVLEDVTMEEVVAEADRLLYLAKSSGRNRVLSAKDSTEATHEKILVADDDHLIVKIIKHRLEKEGFKVYHFPDGASALVGAEDVAADLAIIDVKMPEMDGFELLRRLRMLPSYARTPIMMLTSMGREQDIVRGFKLGANDYVLKPFSIVELLARIHRLLTGK